MNPEEEFVTLDCAADVIRGVNYMASLDASKRFSYDDWPDEKVVEKGMNANEYQTRAMKFAKYKHTDYPFLALGEEAGEVLGKLAKYVRKNEVTLGRGIEEAKFGFGSKGYELHSDLVKELGDVLWQVSACCAELGTELETVMKVNLAKLGDRGERGVIVGEGDNR